ncbi:sigma-70 family RNA polymerase sigma factor [Luteimonas yindakuii]|uniref:RNA polymerase sigma factor n=1 Tax=Luteimonas yindakuii TaxID=2565782 RepID=UPI0010A540B3|nr:sigma-70 family RNA polymerase sigma factor [Luteimonas yindakuii]QCO67118.1 sigma-70 family RNA polymerase sigma factor [Luteimonas yindakuii]
MPLSSHPLQAAGAPPVAMSPPPPTSASGFAIDVPGALLQRARAGERAAFEQLYRWFERPTFTLALRICGDREAAADVLQDTMLKMIDSIGEFRGACPFWGWLRQIAVNEALMRLRRGRRFEGHLDVDEHELAGDVPPPSAAADAAALQRALAGLPVITRSVLWLYHAEGFTHEEIGALMERTPSFSKSQVARGTRRLRELLETPSPASAGALP